MALKLCHFINWSWWYVVLPFWIVPVTILSLVVAMLISGMLAITLSKVFGGH